MTTKEYLQQIYYYDKLTKAKMEEIQQLQSIIIYKSPQWEDKGTSGYSAGSNDEGICKMLSLQEEIEKDIIKLLEIKEEVSNKINSIENNQFKLILTLRYINFKSFEEIAVYMGYSYRNCTRLHKSALKYIEKNKLVL